jgi:hypothetical protein
MGREVGFSDKLDRWHEIFLKHVYPKNCFPLVRARLRDFKLNGTLLQYSKLEAGDLNTQTLMGT